MKKAFITLTVFSTLFALASCDKKTAFNYIYYTVDQYALVSQYLNLPDSPVDYSVTLPDNLKHAGLFPTPVSSEKALLGRVLFYDKHLSSDGTVSCASCHKQELAFSDNAVTSKGVQNQVGVRNSLALGSVANFSAYYGTDLFGSSAIRYFWDNRAATAVEQCTAAMNNPKEMNMTGDDIVKAVQQQPYYRPLFDKAFGNEFVSFDKVTDAIANFINSLGSYHSRFDEGAAANIPNAPYTNPFYSNFNASENRGKGIYISNCASCHTYDMGRPVISNSNNGLQAQTTDAGVGGNTGLASDLGTFKVPTLRNITLTAPYMHDGSLKTLEEVIEHYNSGIQAHPNLASTLKDQSGKPLKMNLSNTDKEDLIAFLGTLRDDKLLTETRFSDPFKH